MSRILLWATAVALCGCELIVSPPEATRTWTFDVKDDTAGWRSLSTNDGCPSCVAMTNSVKASDGMLQFTGVVYPSEGSFAASIQFQPTMLANLAGKTICARVKPSANLASGGGRITVNAGEAFIGPMLVPLASGTWNRLCFSTTLSKDKLDPNSSSPFDFTQVTQIVIEIASSPQAGAVDFSIDDVAY
ncbi:MAG TPA: hypothetical protein VNO55_09845 [Polyangia bacterium]|nr:hypothetical protein [Polyangia bacterium]